jgi:hypothetical protein
VRHFVRLVLWIAVIGVVIGGFIAIWSWPRFLSDFWPLDKATVGPNLLASLLWGLTVGAFLLIFWPPFRRSMDNWVHKHTEHLHAKLDHLIVNHPDVPNHVEGIPDHKQPLQRYPHPAAPVPTNPKPVRSPRARKSPAAPSSP